MSKLLPSFQVALRVLQICGCNPLQQNWISKILQAIALLSSFTLVLSMTLEIPLNWKGLQTMAKLNLYSLAISILVKSYNLVKNKALFEEILNSIDDLFPLNKYNKFDLSLNSKLLKYDNYVSMFIKLYFAAAIVSSVQFFAAPLFTQVNQIAFQGYEICDMSVLKCYLIYLVWQVLVMLFHVIPITIGYDGIFLLLICRGFSAIEVLKCGFRNLKITTENNDANILKINELVDQHNVLLLYIKRFKRFLSGVLLAQFWSSLGGLILCMYMILSQGSSIKTSDLLKFGFGYMLFVTQLFIYCLGGTILIEQLHTIGDEVFAMDWYLQTKIRKKLTFIIARCYYGDNLKAGKMIDLNLMSFVNVLRNSISICTLLLTIGKQEENNIGTT